MKNLSKKLVLTVVMACIAIAFMFTTVNANGGFTLGGGNTAGGNSTTLLGGSNSTGTNTAGSTNTTPLNTTSNITKVNTVSDGNKDLPQTGENDIYIVTAIGVVAIALGGIAYIKSKKYEM